MKQPMQTLSALLLAALFATQTAQAHSQVERSCNFKLLKPDAIGLKSADAQDQHWLTNDLTLEMLESAFEKIKHSADRGNPELYQEFKAYLAALSQRLTHDIDQLEDHRVRTRDHSQDDTIVALENTKSEVEEMQETLEDALKLGNDDALLLEASIVYGLAYVDYDSATSASLASLLLSKKNDLSSFLNLAGELFDRLEKDYTEDTVLILGHHLLRAPPELTAQNEADLITLYEAFDTALNDAGLSYDESDAATLAVLSRDLKLSAAPESLAKAVQQLSEGLDELDTKYTLPLFATLLVRKSDLSSGTLQNLKTLYASLTEHGLDERAATILLSTLVLTEANPTDVEVKAALQFYESINDHGGIDEDSAPTLTAAAILSGFKVTSAEVEKLFSQLEEFEGIEDDAAAVIAFEILLQRHGVKAGLPTDYALVTGLASGNSLLYEGGESSFFSNPYFKYATLGTAVFNLAKPVWRGVEPHLVPFIENTVVPFWEQLLNWF